MPEFAEGPPTPKKGRPAKPRWKHRIQFSRKSSLSKGRATLSLILNPRVLGAVAAIALVWILIVMLGGCASAGMPMPGSAQLVRDEPIGCPNGRVLYLHVYDVNPQTEAALAVVGYSSAQHDHGDPFLVIKVGDDGRIAEVYVSVDHGKAEKLTREEFMAQYGGDPCRVAMSVRAGLPVLRTPA